MTTTTTRPTGRRPSHRAVMSAVAAVSLAGVAAVALPTTSEAGVIRSSATLRSANGTVLGRVHFTVGGRNTLVTAHLQLPGGVGALDAFHGFHIHANDNPANGDGCVADPARPADTWFVSADGHLTEAGRTHGAHAGDLPTLLVNADGSADISFTTGRLTVGQLRNRVVILHAGADNEGNVPVGTAPDQYTPNSPDATAKTAATGNAGDRIGCGVIRIDHR